MFTIRRNIFLLTCLLGAAGALKAQEEIFPALPGRFNIRGGQGRGAQLTPQTGMGTPGQTGAQTTDSPDSLSFEHRDDSKDSVHVSFRFPGSLQRRNLDSSVNDFDQYFPVPSTWQYLGNNGAAAFPLIFQPDRRPGWDAGLHAYDLYRFTIANTPLYRVSRPFSSISYQLASGKEQMLRALHVQQPGARFNFGFEYRLINAPGLFLTQNTNHNNFRFFSNYSSIRKRYNATVMWLANKINASENGGISNDSLLSDPDRKKRFSVPVNLGGAFYDPNPFVTTVNTGTLNKDNTLYFSHSYDFGSSDSLEINDSLTHYMFYPRLRLRHTFEYCKYDYRYRDLFPDSAIYQKWYDINLSGSADTVEFFERWRILKNDFSIIQYPQKKNNAHYLLAGISHQQIRSVGKPAWDNVFLHGEYRNRTSNGRWDVQLDGELHLSGYNTGDYLVSGSLSGKNKSGKGSLRLQLENISRRPSFVFDRRSAFNLSGNDDLQKENITSLGAAAQYNRFSIGFKNHFLLNYSYFSDHYQVSQYGKTINILQLFVSRHSRFGKYWNWYGDISLQQTDGAAPVRVPLLFTRNRLAFEGIFFKNLNLSTGFEVRYFSPYKAWGYSPAIGQFYYQDSITINNRPDVSFYAHFRIRSFTGYLRFENLNTVDFSNGLSFIRNNFTAPHYPSQGLLIRFGIKWHFVN